MVGRKLNGEKEKKDNRVDRQREIEREKGRERERERERERKRERERSATLEIIVLARYILKKKKRIFNLSLKVSDIHEAQSFKIFHYQ